MEAGFIIRFSYLKVKDIAIPPLALTTTAVNIIKYILWS